MQRLRIKFFRGDEVKYISHLDLERLWQRAFRRARLPLAYSEGFSPHPRLSLAVPLALGITSETELMDVYLTRTLSPHGFQSALNQQLPVGVAVLQVQPISPLGPSLQSQVRFVEYRVGVATDKGPAEVESLVADLLARQSLPWQHQRDTGVRSYDLRALIGDIRVTACEQDKCTLGMRLRSDAAGAGRPEQVTRALGFTDYPESIHRTRIILEAR